MMISYRNNLLLKPKRVTIEELLLKLIGYSYCQCFEIRETEAYGEPYDPVIDVAVFRKMDKFILAEFPMGDNTCPQDEYTVIESRYGEVGLAKLTLKNYESLKKTMDEIYVVKHDPELLETLIL